MTSAHLARHYNEDVTMSSREELERHTKLINDGWVRRFTAEEPRLSEMKEFYESLGLEVRVESGIPDESPDCQSCFDVEGFETRYKTIYTRGEPTCEPSGSADMFD
jgi:hypothetical protein